MRCWTSTVSLLLLLLCTSPAIMAGGSASLLSRGEQIYRSGTLSSGKPLEARVEGDVRITAEQLICAHCHRLSGLGSSESGRRIPDITAPALFNPQLITRRELYASRTEGAGTRPAYNEATLARAIRSGIDPSGRVLDPSMPRFALPDEEMAALTAYLKRLSTANADGVTEEELHIATLIGPQVSPHRSEAMLALMRAYLEMKNSGTRSELRRAKHTPWQKESSYPAYRRWVLHTWQLKGAPGEWPEQLTHYYAEQPVFAVIGGIVDGDFQPIADFCNANKLPCLFPTSDQPAANPGFYTLHFNEGRRLEARTLARHLHESARTAAAEPIVQVFRREATAGATALSKALAPSTPLREVILEEEADERFWQHLHPEETLVLWLGAADLDSLGALPRPWPKRIYLQSSAESGHLNTLPAELRERIYMLYPYALPEDAAMQRFRVKAWLRTKGIDFAAPREQSDSYFVVTLFSDIMRHLGLNYSREYAIETVEHMLDSAIATSLYPTVTLAPGQRFAVKGCYLVRPAGNGLVAASRWLVPDD